MFLARTLAFVAHGEEFKSTVLTRSPAGIFWRHLPSAATVDSFLLRLGRWRTLLLVAVRFAVVGWTPDTAWY